MVETAMTLVEVWHLLPTRVVATTADAVASSPSIAALLPSAEGSASVCHSWFIALALVRPIIDWKGVSKGDTM